MKRILLIIAIINMLSEYTYSQNAFNSNLNKEKISLSISNNTIVSGEKLFYKILLLNSNNKPSKLSKVVYIKLIDFNKKTIVSEKVLIKNSIGIGDFIIPYKIKSDSYKLIAYTRYMVNTNNYAQKDLLIINPNNLNNTYNLHLDSLLIEKKNTLISNNSSISTNKKQYANRELVKVNINNTLPEGLYNLSVKKVNPINFFNEKKIISNNKYIKSQIKTETKGRLISGIAFKDPHKKEILKNSKIVISFLETPNEYNIVPTNKKGEFNTITTSNLSSNKVLIHNLYDSEKIYISINDFPNIEYNNITFQKFRINKPALDNFNKRFLYSQIENAFNEVKSDSLIVNKKNNEFELSNYSKEYNLKDYKKFKTLKEVMIEIVDDAWINSEGNFNVRLENNNSTQKDNCLLIVDGIIIKQHKEILDLSIDLIESISVFNKYYVLGPEIFKGVIFIKTKNNSFTPKNDNYTLVNLHEIEKSKIYFKQNYGDKKLNYSSKIPDYRNQLFWLPNLTKPQSTIKFYTSDISGTFEIRLEGYSNNGKQINFSNYFVVK